MSLTTWLCCLSLSTKAFPAYALKNSFICSNVHVGSHPCIQCPHAWSKSVENSTVGLLVADLPVLSMLVVKDHYSMLSDKQYPTFVLRDAQRGSGREVWSWGDQMDQLFVHKMSEVLRVLMIFKLLQTGPEVERGSIDIYNKVMTSKICQSKLISPYTLTDLIPQSIYV